jgi:hypothetical protein
VFAMCCSYVLCNTDITSIAPNWKC